MTYDEMRVFKGRLRYLIHNDPSAYKLAAMIRESRNGTVEEQIQDVFWAFCHPSSRVLLDTLATTTGQRDHYASEDGLDVEAARRVAEMCRDVLVKHDRLSVMVESSKQPET